MSSYSPHPSQQPRFDRRVIKPTLHPRRVTGGIRLQARIAATGTSPAAEGTTEGVVTGGPPVTPGWTWASARWMRLAETHAPGDQLSEGLEYAQAGQTRSIEVQPGGGGITARVQGRMPTAYKTAIRLPTFTHDQWELVIASMSQQAKYAAAILAGELPANIEDLFAPHGLRLFPTDASDVSTSCNCAVFTGIEPVQNLPPQYNQPLAAPTPPPKPTPIVTTPWCKHVCCLMFLIAERLGQNPLLLLALRGMPESDLIERLNQARVLAGLQRGAGGAAGAAALAPAGPAPIYTPHVPLPDRVDRPLEQSITSHGAANFWEAPDPDALADLDCAIAPPDVSHPLLRRLGASPFTGAKFPLVGLLATCYDVISAAAIQGEPAAAPESPGEPASEA